MQVKSVLVLVGRWKRKMICRLYLQNLLPLPLPLLHRTLRPLRPPLPSNSVNAILGRTKTKRKRKRRVQPLNLHLLPPRQLLLLHRRLSLLRSNPKNTKSLLNQARLFLHHLHLRPPLCPRLRPRLPPLRPRPLLRPRLRPLLPLATETAAGTEAAAVIAVKAAVAIEIETAIENAAPAATAVAVAGVEVVAVRVPLLRPLAVVVVVVV